MFRASRYVEFTTWPRSLRERSGAPQPNDLNVAKHVSRAVVTRTTARAAVRAALRRALIRDDELAAGVGEVRVELGAGDAGEIGTDLFVATAA